MVVAVLVVVMTLSGWSGPGARGAGADRPAEEILRELDAGAIPRHDRSRRDEPGHAAEFTGRVRAATEARNALIL